MDLKVEKLTRPNEKKNIYFPLASPDYIKVLGKRSKIGGTPDFIQDTIIPKCSCNNDMTFYAQIDSINNKYMIEDCGMIYIYYCFNCGNLHAFTQSY